MPHSCQGESKVWEPHHFLYKVQFSNLAELDYQETLGLSNLPISSPQNGNVWENLVCKDPLPKKKDAMKPNKDGKAQMLPHAIY